MEVTLNALESWASSNPSDLQKIAKYLKEVCEIRSKTDNEKVKMSSKYTASIITGLPDSYKPPNIKKNFEVLITEGKSAAPENTRDKNTQGLYGIRGKMPNAFTTPTVKYFDNAEVAGLLLVFGYPNYQKKFDPAKFKPIRVIILTDADRDGDHIRCLVLGLFLRYLPFVIEQGKLFAATPPLYGVKIGNKMKFFADITQFIEYVQEIFCKEYIITNPTTGKPFTKRDITKIIYRNREYAAVLESLANTYAIDYSLLEFLLYNKNLSYSKLETAIKKNYQLLNMQKVNGSIMIELLANNAVQTIFLNDQLFSDPNCKLLLDMMNSSDHFYTMNGKQTTMYGLISTFNSFQPSNVSYYKGLGEMLPQDLSESTILPGHGRTLKQYTVNDVKKELKYFTDIQSDKSQFIQGIKVRKEDIV